MKRVKYNNLILALVGFVCAAFFAFYFCSSQKWVLLFRGHQEMFLFDWTYIKGILLHPGGLAELIAKFLVQFFTVGWVGPAVTLVTLGLNAWMVWRIMERTACTGGRFAEYGDGALGQAQSLRQVGVVRQAHQPVEPQRPEGESRRPVVWGIFPLCLLPSVFLAVSLLDYYSFYQGLIAYVAAVFCLMEYSKIKSDRVPLIAGCAMTVGLFFLAGSVALLFAVRALLFDIFVKRRNALLSVVYPVLNIALGLLMIHSGQIATILDAFTPRMYYELDILKMPEIQFVSWVMLSVCIFIAAVSRRIIVKGGVAKVGVSVLCAVVVILSLVSFTDAYKSDAKTRLYRLECLATNEDWDRILKLYGNDVRSQAEANYRNLALARKGFLVEDLFKYRQNGPLSLICDVKSQNDIDLLRLSRVLFAMGNMAAAQSTAFNADQAFGDHVPSMLRMVLQIDLMRGSYATAGKYIRLMEKSLGHSEGATSQRRFLGDDEAVMNDELLGNGRRDLQCEDAFVLYTNPMDDLFRIVDANPSDRMAMEYALSYLLLAKDMDNVVEFVAKHYGDPALRELPAPVQECLLFYSDYYGTMDVDFAASHGMPAEEVARRQSYNLDWCLAHGVTSESLAGFQSFKERYGKALRSSDPKSSLSSFRNTFWYYLLFTQISEN